MAENESSGPWDAGDVATGETNATDYPAISDTTTVATAEPEVLARVPDVGSDERSPKKSPSWLRWDGRLLSAKLSTKLLVGGGVLLVLVAIGLPQLLGPVEGEGGKPPRPDAEESVQWDPTAPPTGTPSDPIAPPTDFNPNIPEIPDFAEQGPSSGNFMPPGAMTGGDTLPPIPNGTDPVNSSAPIRIDPNSVPHVSRRPPITYNPPADHQPWNPNGTEPIAAANRGMTIPMESRTVAGIPARSYRPEPTYEVAPSRSTGPTARFDGVIGTPSYRTSSANAEFSQDTYAR